MGTKLTGLENLIIQQNQILQSISEKLDQSNTFETIIIGLIVAFGGALSAFVFTMVHWRRSERERAESALLTQLRDLVSELETLSLTYWLKDADESDKATETRVKNILRSMARCTKNLKEAKPSESNNLMKLEDMTRKIYDEVTGGDFESKIRKRSTPTANAVSRQCEDAKMLISEILYKQAVAR